jgi:outer membrane protein OmpA-like peptidoglycan-associated protein
MVENADARAVCSNYKPAIALDGGCRGPFEELSMAAHRLSVALVLGIALACCISLAPLCLAQENSNPGTGEPKVDAPGCSNLSIFPKLVASVVVSCHSGDPVEVTMPLQPDAQGFAREKSVRGTYEYREYQITRVDQQEHAFEDLMRLAPMAGFTVKYSAQLSTITARNGDTWILINVSGEFYDVSVVRVKEEPWTPPFKNAEEISREMDANDRVAIYGLAFSTNNQAANLENAKILGEIAKYLKSDPGLSVVVECHKQSGTGNAEADLEITRKRAISVVDWLVADGVAVGRLQPKALGRNKPITENDTPLEMQKNERIELVKTGL